MPRPSEGAVAAFRSLVPDDPSVTLRPMFGNLAAFVNGNMFTGLFGEELFVRVSDAERERLVREGAADFAPMPGRAMRGYVVLPGGWRGRAAAKRSIAAALEWTRAMPAKTGSARAKRPR